MVKLKLVNGVSYACPAFAGTVIQVGESVVVNDDVAAILREDGFYDALNNYHPYFKVEDEAVPAATQEAPTDGEEDAADTADTAESDSDLGPEADSAFPDATPQAADDDAVVEAPAARKQSSRTRTK